MSENYIDYFDDFDDEVKGFVEEPDSDYESSSFSNYDPVKLTPAYHLKQGAEAIEQLKFVVEESGWKKTLIKGSSIVYSKNGIGDNDKVPVLMSEHIIDGFAPQPIFAVIGMRKLWDPWYEEGSLIENLDDTTSLTYMVMRGVAGTKIRDLCLVEKIESSSDGTIYFASTSVASDKVPQVIDKVRAHVYLNGWILEPISHNPPRTKVTYVLQIKINGWVPSVMARKYTLRRPLIVNVIDRYLQKNGPPPMIVSSTPVSRPSHSESESNSSVRSNSDRTDRTDRKINRKTSAPILRHENESSSSPPPPPSSPRRHTIFKQTIISSQPTSSSDSEGLPVRHSTKEIPASSNYEDNEELSSQRALRKQPPLRIQTPPKQKKIYNQTPSSPIQEFTLAQAQPTEPVQLVSPDKAHPPSNIKFNPPPPPSSKPKLIKKHRHTDAVNRAVVAFKDSVNTSYGWKFYMENKGVKVYMKDAEGRSNPIIRGDYTINGNFMASDFVSAAKNTNMRKLWDDRFYDGKDLEIFDNNDVMSIVSLKGTFPISGRDLALCGTVEQDPETGRIVYVTTSVLDPAIPEVKKYVRAHIYYTGWQIDPKFDADGNTKALDIVYIVDIDIKLDSVPSSILKTISTSTPMVVQKLDESLHSTGFPPYVLKSSSKILSENISLGNFQYDLSFVAENNGITDIRLSRIMYPSGFDMAITLKNVKVESLSNTSDIIRITLPSKVTTDQLQIKITKRTSQGFKATYNGVNKIKLYQKKKLTLISVTKDTPVESTQPYSVEVEETENVIQSRPKQRSRKLSKSFQQTELALVNSSINSIDSTLVVKEIDESGTDRDDNHVPRKQKRLSFANSPPSIINPEVLKPEEENKIFDAEVIPSNNGYENEIPSDDEHDEHEEQQEEFVEEQEEFMEEQEEFMEEIEEFEGIDGFEEINEFPPVPIKYDQVHQIISKDVVVISDHMKLNLYQISLMFVSMILAYYAGKLSHN